MRTTYLMNKVQPDGSVRLSIATFEEWLAVLETNKSLPTGQQRHFIVDCIADSQDMDRMVIETTAAEYREWNRERMASARNHALGKTYQMLSLDVPVRVEDAILDLKETLSSSEQVEEQVSAQILAAQLREALTVWKPWANDMLDCYLRGEQRSCTDILAVKYGVSPQVIRKYKHQFEQFIKKFFGGVSF